MDGARSLSRLIDEIVVSKAAHAKLVGSPEYLTLMAD